MPLGQAHDFKAPQPFLGAVDIRIFSPFAPLGTVVSVGDSPNDSEEWCRIVGYVYLHMYVFCCDILSFC